MFLSNFLYFRKSHFSSEPFKVFQFIESMATLSLENKEFELLDCSYSLRRYPDSEGRPSSIVEGTVKVRIESTEETMFMERMLDQKPVSGSVVFKKDGIAIRELTWENGYVISCQNSADMTGTDFVIFSQKMNVSSVQSKSAPTGK